MSVKIHVPTMWGNKIIFGVACLSVAAILTSLIAKKTLGSTVTPFVLYGGISFGILDIIGYIYKQRIDNQFWVVKDNKWIRWSGIPRYYDYENPEFDFLVAWESKTVRLIYFKKDLRYEFMVHNAPLAWAKNDLTAQHHQVNPRRLDHSPHVHYFAKKYFLPDGEYLQGHFAKQPGGGCEEGYYYRLNGQLSFSERLPDELQLKEVDHAFCEAISLKPFITMENAEELRALLQPHEYFQFFHIENDMVYLHTYYKENSISELFIYNKRSVKTPLAGSEISVDVLARRKLGDS